MAPRGPEDYFQSQFSTGLGFNFDGRSVVAADLDADGDLDLVLRNLQRPQVQIVENLLAGSRHALEVRLRSPSPNTQAIGARIRVTCDGTTQVRQVTAGDSFLAQKPLEQHFGLGECERAEPPDFATRAASLRLLDLEGSEHPLVDPHDSRALILNLWAPWCEACKREIPDLQRWAAEHGDTHRLVFVSFESDDLASVSSSAGEFGIAATTLLGAPSLFELYLGDQRIELPITLLLDAQGRPRAQYSRAAVETDNWLH